MTNRLINKVVQKVTVDYCRLSIVSNRDGFLAADAVRSLIYQEFGIELILGSNLDLRIHFELEYKKNDDRRFIYICDSTDVLLPDMREAAHITDFSISDVFPLFADKALLRRQGLDVLERLFDGWSMKRVTMSESGMLVRGIMHDIEDRRRRSADFFRMQLQSIDIDWYHPTKTINEISGVLAGAIREGVYGDVADIVADINGKFQDWIDAEYFATVHSSPLLKARCVNKILPHISGRYGNGDKVALLVVDGFCYWQYVVLRSYLKEAGLNAEEDSTLSWLPSITMLSRQAIFRGADPRQDYKQNPQNERQLWSDFWKDEGFGSYDVQYIYDSDEFAINEGVKRLAIVTAEMDEKMHSSTDYRDLYSLTENWCSRIVGKICAVAGAGYTLYLTTDHGSVLSRGWRSLTPVEKVFLYKDGSRGMRHLIYNNADEQIRFCSENPDLQILRHDNWLSIRDDRCFAREDKLLITHGGSHFLEVVVPFIKIEK